MRKMILLVAAAMLLVPSIAHLANLTPAKKKIKPVVRPEYDIHYGKVVDSEGGVSFSSLQAPPERPRPNLSAQGGSSVPPPPSPGLKIGETAYDYQHNHSSGYQVARMPGADIVHFEWTSAEEIPGDNEAPGRYVAYQSYTISTNTLNQGFASCFPWIIGPIANAGFTNMDVNVANRVTVALHQREDVSLPSTPWSLHYPIPGNCLHVDDGLGGYGSGGCPAVLWPRGASSRDPGNSDVRHLVAHSDIHNCTNDLLWYWRFNGSNWTGPVIVDSTPTLGYVLADDRTGGKVAIGSHADNHLSMNGNNNVVYYESLTDGVGWINGTEPLTQNLITSYGDPNGAQAWLHISTAYDNSGVLNIVWDEQRVANQTSDIAIRHWSSATQTIRPVALGYWPNQFSSGVFDLNLAKVTLGIGDGGTTCGGQANNNYLYVLYTRFDGPTAEEQADHSASGYNNGELYLNVSTDGGNSWSPPQNLTNTKTPNCDPGPADTLSGNPANPNNVCRSEHWATIGMAVSDIDIFFISDKDAGGIPQGEGSWQINPVMYYRIPGGTTNAAIVCPQVAPFIATSLPLDPDCELHTPPGTIKNDDYLSVANIGNALLTGTVTVLPGASWLTVNGGGSFNLSAGSPELSLQVLMNATALSPGEYMGTIRVTHNDTLQPSPIDYPIDLFVADEFHCPQDQVMKSGVADE